MRILSKEWSVVMNKKKVMISGIVVLTIVLMIGVSFALWQMTLGQQSTNTINTACLVL